MVNKRVKVILDTNLWISFLISIEIKSKVNVCRDFKDNFLLALAKDSHANYLITGDKDLLSLNPFGNTRIITFQQFLKE